MDQVRRALLAALLMLGAFSAAPTATLAQDAFPNKPVRIVVPYPPGGASDVTARLLGQKLSELWNQPVVIDNRPGANGILALEYVAKQAPDGTTLLMANLGPNAINAAVYSKLPYDSIKDFAPITFTTLVPQVLVVNPALPVKNLKELLDLARASPGKLNYGTGGNGSANHLAVELMANMGGVSLTAVPYKGDAPAMTDAMSGQVAMTLPTVVAALPNIKAGKLRAIAVTTQTRVASLPDVPTMQEAGLAGYESSSWGGVMAPGGTPPAIVNKINTDIVRVLRMPDIQEKLAGLGATVVAQGPAEFAAFLQSEIKKWDGVAKRANIRLE
ncbi:MAG: tripartite tricarboxylate transporter substrate binding protein [Betaproteobacteria bacterium]